MTSRQIAQGRVDWDRDHFLVTVTGPCSDGDDSATVELRDTEWHALPPVRQAVDEELARRCRWIRRLPRPLIRHAQIHCLTHGSTRPMPLPVA